MKKSQIFILLRNEISDNKAYCRNFATDNLRSDN